MRHTETFDASISSVHSFFYITFMDSTSASLFIVLASWCTHLKNISQIESFPICRGEKKTFELPPPS